MYASLAAKPDLPPLAPPNPKMQKNGDAIASAEANAKEVESERRERELEAAKERKRSEISGARVVNNRRAGRLWN